MSAFPPFLGVSPAAPRSLLGRRNLCRDSCLLWPLFACGLPEHLLVGTRPLGLAGERGQGLVEAEESGYLVLGPPRRCRPPTPPLTLPFPCLRFGVLFISASICILTRVPWGTPHRNGSKFLLWS